MSNTNITHRKDLTFKKKIFSPVRVNGIGGSRVSNRFGNFKNLQHELDKLEFVYIKECPFNIICLPSMERLFSVTKTEDRFICVSKKDKFVMEFLRDQNSGFYVRGIKLPQSSAVELPIVLNNIGKSTAEVVPTKLSFMATDSSTAPKSPLTTTPEMEIDNSLLTPHIEIVDDDTETDEEETETAEDDTIPEMVVDDTTDTDEEDINNNKTVKKVSKRNILSGKEKAMMKLMKNNIILLRNNNDSNEKINNKNNNHDNNNNNNNKNTNKVIYKAILSEKEQNAVEVITLIHQSTDHPCDKYLKNVIETLMKNKTRTWPDIVNVILTNYMFI